MGRAGSNSQADQEQARPSRPGANTADDPSTNDLAAAADQDDLDQAEPSADEIEAEEGADAEPPPLGGNEPEPPPTEHPAPTNTALVSRSRSLAQRDPLQAYINETRRHPLLSREAEHELAVRYHEDGDVDAARDLVTANLRLVVKIAHEYRRAYRNVLDLIQEGNIGLMHAVKKFDPYKGVKLSSYAAWWIRAYILKFVLNNWRLVKIGTTQNQRKLFFNLRKEVEALQRMGVEDPSTKLLAERLDVPEHDVTTMQKRLAGSDVSLDTPARTDDEGGASRMDFVTSEVAGPDQEVEERQFSELVRDKVAEFGETLQGREKEIFDLRTVADEPLTLQQIGERYGVSRERARQLERRMMDRLRDHLKSELGDAVQVALGSSEDA